jgi:hypothetical protein
MNLPTFKQPCAGEFLVRFARPDGGPVNGGSPWLGVMVNDTDKLNALIQARANNRTLSPFSQLVALDVLRVG